MVMEIIGSDFVMAVLLTIMTALSSILSYRFGFWLGGFIKVK